MLSFDIFLSYARVDRDCAIELRDELIAGGHSVWHDLKDLEAGQWWSQIAAQLAHGRGVEHIVLLVSPQAIASKIVEREWRLARREGKTLSLAVPPAHKGHFDRMTLPRWMRAEHHYDLSEPDQRARLKASLANPGKRQRRPDPLKHLPEGYVRRTEKISLIKAALLDEQREAKAGTVVLSGAGGFGKSTLAVDIMNDADLQDACYDGVLWVELGEDLLRIAAGPQGAEAVRGAVTQKIERLIWDLTSQREVVADLDRAKERLRHLLATKQVLLVIDDVWAEEHALHFIEAAPEASRIVTTRRADILADAGAHIRIDRLTHGEALELIGSRLPERTANEAAELQHLAVEHAGGWPILLRLINGQLKLATMDRPGRTRDTLATALRHVKAQLDREGLGALDPTKTTARDRAVRLSVGVSLEMLAEEDMWHSYHNGFHKLRYLDLAGFEGSEVPIAAINRLWTRLGELKTKVPAPEAADAAKGPAHCHASLDESVAILERLYSLGLLEALDADAPNGTVRLHDVLRTYLASMQSDIGRKAFHRSVVLAYDACGSEALANMAERERRYFYTWYPTHLAAADKPPALDRLLLDPDWMQRKLNALQSPLSLLADYERLAKGRTQSLVGRALRIMKGIISRDPNQLLLQLVGRLMDIETPEMESFVRDAHERIKRPAIVPAQRSLTAPGPEIARLEGHEAPVTALAVLPDGRLASASGDTTIRLWDLNEGIETARLVGHSGWVMALTVLRDGRLASSSKDKTIRLWDLSKTVEVLRIDHEDDIIAIGSSPCGNLISASRSTIRLWDVDKGVELQRIEDSFSALDVLPDGHVMAIGTKRPPRSGYAYRIRLLDTNTFTWVKAFDIYDKDIYLQGIYALPRGLLATTAGALSRKMRIWDINTGGEPIDLEDSTGAFHAVVALSENRVAAGGAGPAIRIWDLARGTEAGRLTGHVFDMIGTVWALTVLPDGRLASGGRDATIRIWDPEGITKGRNGIQVVVGAFSDARIAFEGDNYKVHVWDARRATAVQLEGHNNLVRAIAELPDGRLVTTSADKTIRIWDQNTGSQIMCIDSLRDIPHSIFRFVDDPRGRVVNDMGESVLAVLPDGRLASVGSDDKIRLWDVATGREIARLEGHRGHVDALCVMPDGRLASSGSDKTVRIWDLDGKIEVARLERHEGVLAVLSDGRLITTSEEQDHRLWTPRNGEDPCGIDLGTLVRYLLVLPDGRLLSANHDSTIRLWDLERSVELARLELDAPVRRLYLLDPLGWVLAYDQNWNVHSLNIEMSGMHVN